MYKAIGGILAWLFLLAAFPLHAEQIYSCEKDGHKTFSQQPCGDDAKPMDIGGGQGLIVLPEEFTEKTANDICAMMFRSMEAAVTMKRQGIREDRATDRIFGYLREHVANFDEAVKREPGLFGAFRSASYTLVRGAYEGSSATQGELDAARGECSRQVWDGYQKSHKTVAGKPVKMT